VLLVLSVFPGLPMLPFLAMGSGLGLVAWNMRKKKAATAKSEAAAKPAAAADNLESLLRVEPIAVEMGLGLVKFVAGGQESPLIKRIGGIRRQLASELGFLLGPVRIIDNMTLKAHEYVILLKGVEVARYELPAGCELAIPVGKVDTPPEGRQTRDPAFGMTGWWVPADQAERARRTGFTVVDAVSVLGTHLAEVIRRHAHELLLAPGCQEDPGPRGRRTSQSGGRPGPQTAAAGGRAARASESAPRAGFHPRLRDHPGGAGRSRPHHQKPNPSDRVRAPVHAAAGGQTLPECRGELPAYLLDAALEQTVESAVEHGEQNSHLTLGPPRFATCCGEST
jgi:flagellar biosynthesis protein FlhA